jgi:murein DD-endopeptidase MepM/ murein hydrolase activator NlpD
MRSAGSSRGRVLGFSTPVIVAFFTGVLLTAALIWSYQNAPVRLQAKLADDCGDPAEARPSKPSVRDERETAPDAAPVARPLEVIGVDALADLRSRALTLPVQGVDSRDLQETFEDKRGEGRRHEALDILAARNTPILAVEDGTVARLFTSKAGGLTIYQFDPSSTYAYYYAHLERYAPGLTDGERVKRGQVLGYVGTSGNAPKDTPHLHFAIFRLTDKKQWWQGTPIDPFAVLR